jgi:hypothetical protein
MQLSGFPWRPPGALPVGCPRLFPLPGFPIWHRHKEGNQSLVKVSCGWVETDGWFNGTWRQAKVLRGASGRIATLRFKGLRAEGIDDAPDGYIKFHLDHDSFTPSLEALAEEGPVWYAEEGVFVTQADDPRVLVRFRCPGRAPIREARVNGRSWSQVAGRTWTPPA